MIYISLRQNDTVVSDNIALDIYYDQLAKLFYYLPFVSKKLDNVTEATFPDSDYSISIRNYNSKIYKGFVTEITATDKDITLIYSIPTNEEVDKLLKAMEMCNVVMIESPPRITLLINSLLRTTIFKSINTEIFTSTYEKLSKQDEIKIKFLDRS